MGKCQPQSVMSSFESSLWLPADFVNDGRRQRGGALLLRSAWDGHGEHIRWSPPEAYGRSTQRYSVVCVCSRMCGSLSDMNANQRGTDTQRWTVGHLQ